MKTKKTKKTKQTDTTLLSTREQFAETVDEIATWQIRVRFLTAQRDRAIQAAQDEYGARIEQLQSGIKERLAAAEAYALAHRDQVLEAGKQSGETPLASYGFRVHPPSLKPLNRRWTWETILEAVRTRFGQRFIRVQEELAKDELKAHLHDADLAAVGLRVEQRETFSVEPKVEGGEPEAAAARVAA